MNYSKSKIDNIYTSADQLYSALRKSGDWINSNLKYEEKDLLAHKFKVGRVEAARIRRSLRNRPVFAMFGVSQVGKSYLVKNLLSIEGKNLEIVDGNSRYDFLSDINPPGNGAESTGVVTRFSVDVQPLNKDFPIQCRLLGIKDIFLVLCDSFFNDLIKLEKIPESDELEIKIEKIKEMYTSASEGDEKLTEDDVIEIRQYFKKKFQKFNYYVDRIEKSGFWDTLDNLVTRIPTFELIKVLGIIWGENVYYNAVFSRLITELNTLNFENYIWTKFDAILRSGGHILDVSRLSGILEDEETIDVYVEGRVLSVRIALLSALCYELVLPLSEELKNEKKFLENTDLLDFPGARGRLQLNQEDISVESIEKLFLRGKIAYLFNSYSDNYEINNLLFCMNDSQIEVNDLPDLINNWIEENVGRNSVEREENLTLTASCPLFVIFTFFNRQLEYNATNDEQDLNYKWDNRFNKFFVDGAVTTKYSWHIDWTQSNPNFANFFLLRDFRFSASIYSGFEERGRECSVVSSREVYLERLKSSFINFPFVQKHFPEPIQSWEDAASLNLDGSDRIISSLLPSANNKVKINSYLGRLSQLKVSLSAELRKKVIDNDISEQRRKAFSKSRTIEFGLIQLFSNPQIQFNAFISNFLVSEVEIYNLIHEHYVESSVVSNVDQFLVFRQTYPMLSSDFSRVKNLELLQRELFFDNIEEVEQFLKEQRIDLDRVLENKQLTTAERLVDVVIVSWRKKMMLDHFQSFFDAGLGMSVFNSFVDSLMETFELFRMKERLIEIFQSKIQTITNKRYAEDYLATITSAILNEFISNFGYTFIPHEQLDEIKVLSQTYPINLNVLERQSKAISEAELQNLFDLEGKSTLSVASHLTEGFQSYMQKIKVALLNNCGYVSYDVEVNDQLKDIIHQIEKLEFHFHE